MKRMGGLFFLSIAAVFVLVSCGGGGGGGGGSTAVAPAPPPPEAVTSIVPQTGTPKIAGFDLQFKQGDYWLYNWTNVNRTTTYYLGNPSFSSTTKNGTARIILGAPKTILGITFFEVNAQYTGEIPASSHITWQYLASFNNKIYGYKDGYVYLIFDAQNGNWVGGTFFGGTTAEGIDDRILNTFVLIDGSYLVSYPENFDISSGKEEYYVQGVGPYKFHAGDHFNWPGSDMQSDHSETFTLVESS